MATINSNFLKLKAGYLFPEIARRVRVYTEENPDKAARIIRCGIGDVTEPLPAAVIKAMHDGVDEMGIQDQTVEPRIRIKQVVVDQTAIPIPARWHV